MAIRPTMVQEVLILPLQPAAMTVPLLAATMRRPLMANSLAMTMNTSQDGIRPQPTKIIMQAVTSSLSASGSRNLPKSLT